MAATPVINTLPPELLTRILRCIYTTSNGQTGDLARCLVVCKLWRNLTLPVLYRDLVLGSDRLPRFLAGFDKQASRITQSLTIHLTYPPSQTASDLNDTPMMSPEKLQDNWLRRLADQIAGESLFPHLITCSLASTCLITRAAIARFLRALPASCINLEIDTDHYDVDDIDQGPQGNNDSNGTVADGRVHLCDELRALLPRLHQARINLRTVCSAIVGTCKAAQDEFQALPLPSMQSLLIVCGNGWRIKERCPAPAQISPASEPTSWQSVIQGLQRVAKNGDKEKSKLIVTGMTGGSEEDRRHHKTLLRCCVDRVGQGTTTMACPVMNIPRIDFDSPDIYYARTETGGFVAGGFATLQEVAEGRPWRKLTTGTRLPAEAADASSTAQELGMVWTEAEWRQKYPRKSCTLWLNEKRTGMRLLEAEERQGCELRGLTEMTPDGWHRPVEQQGGILARDE